MTPRMWEQLQAFIAAGVRVVFLGPPPTQLADGTPILKDFCTLMGADIEGERAYWQAFERRYGQLDWTAREQYEFAPLPAVEAERYVYEGDGQRIGVKGIRPELHLHHGLQPWRVTSGRFPGRTEGREGGGCGCINAVATLRRKR